MDLSCLLNCLRVSLLGFSSFYLNLLMTFFTLSGVSILYGGSVQFRRQQRRFCIGGPPGPGGGGRVLDICYYYLYKFYYKWGSHCSPRVL